MGRHPRTCPLDLPKIDFFRIHIFIVKLTVYLSSILALFFEVCTEIMNDFVTKFIGITELCFCDALPSLQAPQFGNGTYGAT